MKTENSDHTLWGLEEQSRFPLKAVGWELVDGVFVIKGPRRIDGTQPYAVHVFGDIDVQILAGVKRLLEEHPEDFQVAASNITPEAWRLLFYRNCYTAESLTAFRFSAASSLRQLSVTNDDGGDPPQTWLGTDRGIDAISNDLEMALREMGEAPASAAWLVLCLAQRANLTKSEVLLCSWWDPAWIKAFTEYVRIVP
jgi:hypothetical protein